MATSFQENVPSTYHPASRGGSACVLNAVTAQALRRPDAVAMTAGARVLTYNELDCQANRLARHLRSLGVGADVPVGLCLPRSFEMVIGALGILKAGGAYMPMDPAYPPRRLAFMLEDAQAPVLVTNSDLAERLSAPEREMVILDGTQAPAELDHPPKIDIMANDLAYLIHTSGSTGKPKGVEITHAGLSNLVSWHRHAFAVTPADRASHIAGLGFDAAVWELWPYLTAGASAHLADDITRSSPELLRDWLLEQKITISFVPTPIAERLLSLTWPQQTPLRILLTGGDTLGHYPPTGLPFRLINNYGPTECTVVATSGEVLPDTRPDALPPIGSAITGARVYLLDERLSPVAAGVPGEIYVGGAGVARGYRNQPELTSRRFVPDPFSGEPGRLMYKTGDLARALPDGQLVFLGRMDDQIKIRGHRIEPNEIVAALGRLPGVLEGLVIAREDTPGDKRLVAYIVIDSDADLSHASLRDSLRQTLPDYMIPAAFVVLDRFPLTLNGKIDREALPAPEATATLRDAASPTPRFTAIQSRIAKIVAGLLGLESVRVDDNFFLLGGHSLLGAQLIARLRDAFGLEISLRTLFTSPTVAGLAFEVERFSEGKEETEAGETRSAAKSGAESGI
jgi:amino acid adenylation domain-containing protein